MMPPRPLLALALADQARMLGDLFAIGVDQNLLGALVHRHLLADPALRDRIAIGVQVHEAVAVHHPVMDLGHRWDVGG